MHKNLVHAPCPYCRESLRVSTSVACAECLCEWCTHSLLYVVADDAIHLLDLSIPSWASDAELLASKMGFRFLDVEDHAVRSEVFELIPCDVARDIDVISVDATSSEITVASPRPGRLDVFDSLRFLLGQSIVSCLASRDAIHRILSCHLLDNQDVRHDPQEDAAPTRPFIHRAFKEAKRETDQYWRCIGDPSSRNYDRYLLHICRRQKRILEQQFGIAWSSPIEMNPAIRVD